MESSVIVVFQASAVAGTGDGRSLLVRVTTDRAGSRSAVLGCRSIGPV